MADDDPIQAAIKAERARIKGILECREADRRGVMAHHLAFETDTTVEAAKAILAKMPQGPREKSALEHAMEMLGTPGIGFSAPNDERSTSPASPAQIYAARKRSIDTQRQRLPPWNSDEQSAPQ